MTNVEALKRLFQQVGGDPSTLDGNTNLELLNAISETLGGETGAEQNADGIDNVAAVASGGGGPDLGEKKKIVLGQAWTFDSAGYAGPLLFASDFNASDYLNKRFLAEVELDGQVFDCVAWAYPENTSAKFCVAGGGEMCIEIEADGRIKCYAKHGTFVNVSVSVYSNPINAAPVYVTEVYRGTEWGSVQGTLKFWAFNREGGMAPANIVLDLIQNQQIDAIWIVALGAGREAFSGVETSVDGGVVQTTYRSPQMEFLNGNCYAFRLRDNVHDFAQLPMISLEFGDGGIS